MCVWLLWCLVCVWCLLVFACGFCMAISCWLLDFMLWVVISLFGVVDLEWFVEVLLFVVLPSFWWCCFIACCMLGVVCCLWVCALWCGYVVTLVFGFAYCIAGACCFVYSRFGWFDLF